MRRGHRIFNKGVDRIQDYGWTIPVFGLGTLFGLSLLGKADLLEAITAFGTLAAAFAAFWSINFSRRVQRQRDEQADAERKPFLHISLINSVPRTSSFDLQFINLSQQAIWVNEVLIPDTRMEGVGIPLSIVKLAVPAGSLVSARVNLLLLNRSLASCVYIYFNYALTGPLLYRLKVPIKVTAKQGHSTLIEFGLGDQSIEGPVFPPFDNYSVQLKTYAS